VKLRLGTRGSDLALWQARHVAALLAPEAQVELVILQTRGDQIDDRPLTQVEGKAFFTAEIERALLDGHVDLAVHSHKDLPTESPPGLVVVAVPPRGPAHERLLVSAGAWAPDAPMLPLRRGASVGTSSPRREQQLLALRPDLVLAGLRGNVPTRVRRLQEGRYGAILLAAAGLSRLRLDTHGLHAVDLPPELLVPAPAQGALAVQIRAGEPALAGLLVRRLHDADTAARIEAERTLLSMAGGGCSLPLGAHVTRLPGTDTWRVQAFLGADQPRAGCAARWAVAEGLSPADAVAAVLPLLECGASTQAGPLAGLIVAIAGSSDDAHGSALGARLAQLGAQVRHEAWLAHVDLPAPGLRAALASLLPGDVLAVTSRRAAARLAGSRLARGVTVAAVGPSTAEALAGGGLRAAVVGEQGARSLAEALVASGAVKDGTRVLFPCAEEARPELPELLELHGARVERLVVYRTLPADPAPARAACDVRVYASPSAVDAACRAHARAGDGARNLGLGPATTEALRARGLVDEADAPAEPALSADDSAVWHALPGAAGALAGADATRGGGACGEAGAHGESGAASTHGAAREAKGASSADANGRLIEAVVAALVRLRAQRPVVDAASR